MDTRSGLNARASTIHAVFFHRTQHSSVTK